MLNCKSEPDGQIVLRTELERIALRALRYPTPIVDFHRVSSNSASSWRADIVNIRLADGNELRVFLKDFSSSKAPKSKAEEKRIREIYVYKDVLARADLGTAKYYGSHWDTTHKRFWLFLELVSGTSLRNCEFHHWLAAARWLGRFHGYFTSQSEFLTTCNFLRRQDAIFFRSIEWSYLSSVAEIFPRLASRIALFQSLPEELSQQIMSQPITLAHGWFHPDHILVDMTLQPVRVCAIDWELATVGSGLWDLALLTYEAEPWALGPLLEAYKTEVANFGVSALDQDKMIRMLDCFQVYILLRNLGKAIHKSRPESETTSLMKRLEQLCERVAS